MSSLQERFQDTVRIIEQDNRIAELERHNAELVKALRDVVDLPTYASAPSYISRAEYSRRMERANQLIADYAVAQPQQGEK